MFEEDELPIDLKLPSNYPKNSSKKMDWSELGEMANSRTVKFQTLKKTSNEDNLDENQRTLKANFNKSVLKSMVLSNSKDINPLIHGEVRNTQIYTSLLIIEIYKYSEQEESPFGSFTELCLLISDF